MCTWNFGWHAVIHSNCYYFFRFKNLSAWCITALDTSDLSWKLSIFRSCFQKLTSNSLSKYFYTKSLDLSFFLSSSFICFNNRPLRVYFEPLSNFDEMKLKKIIRKKVSVWPKLLILSNPINYSNNTVCLFTHGKLINKFNTCV